MPGVIFFDKFIILRKIQSFASPFPKIRKWHSCFFYQNCNILIPKLIKKQHLSTFLTRSHYRMGNNKPSHFKTHYLIPVFIVVVTQIKTQVHCLLCIAARRNTDSRISLDTPLTVYPGLLHATHAPKTASKEHLSLVYFLLFAVRKKWKRRRNPHPSSIGLENLCWHTKTVDTTEILGGIWMKIAW